MHSRNHEGHEAHGGENLFGLQITRKAITMKSMKCGKGNPSEAVRSQYEASESILQLSDIKINEKAVADSRKLHVGKDLRFMDRCQFRNSLEFEQDLISDKQINAVSTLNGEPLVHHGER